MYSTALQGGPGADSGFGVRLVVSWDISTDCALGTPIGLIGLRNGLRQKTSLRAAKRAPTHLPKSTANRIGSRPNESRSNCRGSDHHTPPSRRGGWHCAEHSKMSNATAAGVFVVVSLVVIVAAVLIVRGYLRRRGRGFD